MGWTYFISFSPVRVAGRDVRVFIPRLVNAEISGDVRLSLR